MARPIITFLSDFGLDDWFVGVVHGVLHEVCPDAHIVNLTHLLEPGDVPRAAFMLECATPDFPPGTIHLAVVDPGVGTERRALAVQAHGQYFVGPDNGILEWALCDPAGETRSLEDERYFRLPMSRTFHGRDVFAPVAAHLACGVGFETLGPRLASPVRVPRPAAHCVEGRLEGCVMFIDHFGNALTNISAATLAQAFPGTDLEQLAVVLPGLREFGVARSYGDAPIGTLVGIVGSSGRLEIAQVGGHATSRFGIGTQDRVTVRRGAARA